ncbi:MAG TPA: hypothetical protein VIW74_04855, partial [Pyrinomonadaceae bacterium]
SAKARLLAPKARFLAPKARNMIARGKREARRPWISVKEKGAALKGRKYGGVYFGLSGLDHPFEL